MNRTERLTIIFWTSALVAGMETVIIAGYVSNPGVAWAVWLIGFCLLMSAVLALISSDRAWGQRYEGEG